MEALYSKRLFPVLCRVLKYWSHLDPGIRGGLRKASLCGLVCGRVADQHWGHWHSQQPSGCPDRRLPAGERISVHPACLSITISYDFISLRMTQSKKTDYAKCWVEGILLNNRKQWITDLCNNKDEFPKPAMLRRRSLIQEYTPFAPLRGYDVQERRKFISSDRHRNNGCFWELSGLMGRLCVWIYMVVPLGGFFGYFKNL